MSNTNRKRFHIGHLIGGHVLDLYETDTLAEALTYIPREFGFTIQPNPDSERHPEFFTPLELVSNKRRTKDSRGTGLEWWTVSERNPASLALS